MSNDNKIIYIVGLNGRNKRAIGNICSNSHCNKIIEIGDKIISLHRYSKNGKGAYRKYYCYPKCYEGLYI